jgi:hypothetical protein
MRNKRGHDLIMADMDSGSSVHAVDPVGRIDDVELPADLSTVNQTVKEEFSSLLQPKLTGTVLVNDSTLPLKKRRMPVTVIAGNPGFREATANIVHQEQMIRELSEKLKGYQISGLHDATGGISSVESMECASKGDFTACVQSIVHVQQELPSTMPSSPTLSSCLPPPRFPRPTLMDIGTYKMKHASHNYTRKLLKSSDKLSIVYIETFNNRLIYLIHRK